MFFKVERPPQTTQTRHEIAATEDASASDADASSARPMVPLLSYNPDEVYSRLNPSFAHVLGEREHIVQM